MLRNLVAMFNLLIYASYSKFAHLLYSLIYISEEPKREDVEKIDDLVKLNFLSYFKNFYTSEF